MHNMDVDDFMRHGFDDISVGDNEIAEDDDKPVGKSKSTLKRKRFGKLKKKEGVTKIKHKRATLEDKPKPEAASSGETVEKHKNALKKLEQSDPDFFKFLQEEDADLLNFDLSEGEEEVSEFEDDEQESNEVNELIVETTKAKRKAKKSGAKSLDDDDNEGTTTAAEEMDESGQIKVTLTMVDDWNEKLENGDVSVTADLVDAFSAAIVNSGVQLEAESRFVIAMDRNVLNRTIACCYRHLPSALDRLLAGRRDANGALTSLRGVKGPAGSFKHWKRHRVLLKHYLGDLVKFLRELQDEEVIRATVSHVTQLLDFYAALPKLTKLLLKALIRVWSRKEESCRIIAFLAIMRLVKNDIPQWHGLALKNMYLAYVQNSKAVNQETWPFLRFMQRSFGELCAEQPSLAYQYAFVYVRQTAIHLRNAMIHKKKELTQTVYNWQYVQCLYLWATVLTTPTKFEVEESHLMEELIYPFCQVVTGCARLLPSSKYWPLRFHCARILLMIARQKRIHTSLIHLLLEVLQDGCSLFNKRHTRQSLKPQRFDTMLKASKSQMEENGFKDAAVETTYELLLEASNVYCCSMAFPEFTFHCIIALRRFAKECRVASYSRQMRGLVEKLQQHADWLMQIRNAVDVDLTVPESIEKFEAGVRKRPTAENPLKSYYESWRKLRNAETKRKLKEEETKKKDQKQNQNDDSNSESGESSNSEHSDAVDSEPKKKKKAVKKPKLEIKEVIKVRKGPQIVDLSHRYDLAEPDLVQDLVLSDFE